MGTMDSVATSVILLFTGLVVLWVGLIVATLFRLVGRHRQTYQEMLRSSLIPVLGFPGSLTTLKFIGLRKHRVLGDGTLSVLSDLALFALAACVAAMVVLVVLTKAL
jgi:hypothetical protein